MRILAGFILLIVIGGCRNIEPPHPPKFVALHTVTRPARTFDSDLWKTERIPSYRDIEIGIRASMADDVLRRFKIGTTASELFLLLDEPNRADLREDSSPEDRSFFGDHGYLLLSYPVVVDDGKAVHEDLQFLFDHDGRLSASRRVKRSGSIRMGP